MEFNLLNILIMDGSKAYHKYCDKVFDDSLPDVNWRVKLRCRLYFLGDWLKWWKWYYLFKEIDQKLKHSVIYRSLHMPKRPDEKNIFCKCSLHRPLYDHKYSFKDVVSGKTVYEAECSCGLLWITDSLFGWFGDKVKRAFQKVDPHLEECKQKVKDIKFPRKKKDV